MNIGIWFALLVAVIQTVEIVLGAGTGAQKKQAVIDFITKVNTEMKLNIPAVLMNNLGILIDLIVWLFNTIGSFSKPK